MKTKVKLINCGVDTRDNKIFTYVLTFPRIILADFSKHRAFAFNTSSSRAISFESMVKAIKEDPFIPLHFQAKHKGMQGYEYLGNVEELQNQWLKCRDLAIEGAEELNNMGVTKQLCNRLLEPFMWIKMIVTTGEAGLLNFFKQRCPRYIDLKDTSKFYFSIKEFDYNYPKHLTEYNKNPENSLLFSKGLADIHIQHLAELMYDEYCHHTSKLNLIEENHVYYPFKDPENYHLIPKDKLYYMAGKCATMSYTKYIDEDSFTTQELVDKYIKIGKSLLENIPIHWSPFEHILLATSKSDSTQFPGFITAREDLSKNMGKQNFITSN